MTQREEILKEYLTNQAAAHKILIAKGYDFLDADNIWTILQYELDLEYQEVLHKRLSVDSILEVILRHVDANGQAIGKITQSLTEEDVLWVPVLADEIKKATVRNDGRVWVIHKNDLDPHPSVPHAHDYQNNVKLDLYNGNLYNKTKLIGRIKEKELSKLKEKIKNNHPNIKFKDQS